MTEPHPDTMEYAQMLRDRDEAAKKEAARFRERMDLLKEVRDEVRAEARAEFETEFQARLEKELEAAMPPDPLTRLPWPLRQSIESLYATAERIEGPVTNSDFERASAEMARDRFFLDAASELASVGITCIGGFADGSLVLRSNDTGQYHYINSIDGLTTGRLLQLASPRSWGAFAPIDTTFRGNTSEDQVKKKVLNVLNAIAMISGAVRLEADFATFMAQLREQAPTKQTKASAAGPAVKTAA